MKNYMHGMTSIMGLSQALTSKELWLLRQLKQMTNSIFIFSEIMMKKEKSREQDNKEATLSQLIGVCLLYLSTLWHLGH